MPGHVIRELDLRLRQRGALTAFFGRVANSELADENTDGPAVPGHVIGHQAKNVQLRLEPDELEELLSAN